MRAKQVNHFAIADICRANPGEWQPVKEYNSTQSATGIAQEIRTACVKRSGHRRSAWVPAGAFEARHELTEFGARVEARYVGGEGR